jgi:protein involved in polysaccharide export with SLBB domain
MKRTILICFWLFIICFVGIGQIRKETESGSMMETLSQERLQASMPQVGIALESTIDPEKYFVGPSDVLSVNIWMSPPLSLNLTVTPEGTLIIPTVGEVLVSDQTLSRAKERVRQAIRKKYLTPEVTVTLIKPRPIIVSVVGNVVNPGLYALSSIDRATRAIEEANKLAVNQEKSDDIVTLLEEMSTRNIFLKHRDGTHDRVDITKFLATKEDKWNPYLREGDVIVIPRKSKEKNVFGIYGEVNAPGRYEFVEGDSLLDMFLIGQGFTRLAMTDSVEFSRLNKSGTEISKQILNITNILETRQPNFPIESGDRVVVKAKIELREDYRVTVKGEVLYPGTYPITKLGTRLSDIIRLAGGFTEFASLKTAEVVRQSIKRNEVDIERLMSLRGGAPEEDSTDYNLETELRIKREIVNVDFDKLFNANDTAQDIILQSEDEIVVPSVKKTIYVFGQVVSPGHIPFVNGESPRYYIAKAGGFTERARASDMKIIKAKTKQWLDPDESTLEESDYIWVPKDPDRPFTYYMTIASQMASVLSVVIGIAVVIIQVSK